MPTRAIVCAHCGNKGEIEVRGVDSDAAPAGLFRHLGHNPFSGHMHFQCPVCGIVLLVDPVAVLSDKKSPLLPRETSREKADGDDVFRICPVFQRIFQH